MVLSGPGRYAAVDVHYPPTGGAVAALVIVADARFETVTAEHTVCLPQVEPYRPGAFSTRELPAIAAVLAHAGPVDLLVVDGYVHLDPHGRPGLGAHAHAAFKIPVIGVAKTAFRSASHAIEIRRGTARRPLYVTAAGIPPGTAATLVQEMAGQYRIPDALRCVDTVARTTGLNTPPGSPTTVDHHR